MNYPRIFLGFLAFLLIANPGYAQSDHAGNFIRFVSSSFFGSSSSLDLDLENGKIRSIRTDFINSNPTTIFKEGIVSFNQLAQFRKLTNGVAISGVRSLKKCPIPKNGIDFPVMDNHQSFVIVWAGRGFSSDRPSDCYTKPAAELLTSLFSLAKDLPVTPAR